MYYFLGILAGLMLAVQNPYNSNLGKEVGSPISGGFIIYLLGTIEFIVLLLVMGNNPISIAGNAFADGGWWLLGGIFGASFITSVIILFPILGPINAVIFPTLGQIVAGLVYDWLGLFGTTQVPVKLLSIVGLILLLVGVVLTSLERNAPVDSPKISPLHMLWAFIAGAFSTTQGIFNGNLARIIHSDVGATFIAFLTGAIFSFIVISIMRLFSGKMVLKGFKSITGWVAATLGAGYVLIMTILTPALGPGLAVGLALVGVMVGSAIVENFGLFGVAKKPITLIKIVGILIFIGGVVLTKIN